MIGYEEVRAVPSSRAALSPVDEPDEVSGVAAVPSHDTRWPAKHGELSGKSLR
jgi:hypothetical protein